MPTYKPRKPKMAKKKSFHKFDVIKSLAIPMVIIILFLIVLPMIMLFGYSFIEKNGIAYQINLSNYITAFTTSYYWKSLLNSFKFALIATFICFILGYPFAYFLSKVHRKYQGIILLLLNAPMWVNMTLRVFGLKALLGNGGIIQRFLVNSFNINVYNNGVSLVIGLVYIYLPFMIIPIYTSIIKIDDAYINAGYDLGANPKQTFLKVTFPLSFSGVLSGITMVFLPTATAIVAPEHLYNTMNGLFIGQIIETNVSNGYYGAGSAISIVLAVIITLMSITANKFDRYAELSNEGN